MPLDLTALRNATAQLEDALRYARGDLARGDPALAVHLRAGAIQAFEFTYELAFKTLRRYLRLTEPDPSAVDELSFNAVIRRAYALRLLNTELTAWQGFRQSRGTTSHAYDEAKAESVFNAIPSFLVEVAFMTARLDERGPVA
jgi:nucleotidyltransferase substrate binding protein (TIGR01987 family)